MDLLPVVRIFTGFAEDFMALTQTLEMIQQGSIGAPELRSPRQRDVQKCRQDLRRAQQQPIHPLERAEERGRTA